MLEFLDRVDARGLQELGVLRADAEIRMRSAWLAQVRISFSLISVLLAISVRPFLSAQCFKKSSVLLMPTPANLSPYAGPMPSTS